MRGEKEEGKDAEEAGRLSSGQGIASAKAGAFLYTGAVSEEKAEAPMGPPVESILSLMPTVMGKKILHNATYSGTVNAAGKPHGRGVKTFANGNCYEGDFRDGLRHGKGTWSTTDGGRYEGDWVGSKQHGVGTLTSAGGGNVYVGGFAHGQPHGAGTSTAADVSTYLPTYPTYLPTSLPTE